MAEVRAFPALRYDVKVAGPLDDLICPPYDVISPEERAALAARSRGNFVHVELPRPTPEGYEEAAAFLARWRGDRALVPDPPSIYVHAHEFALGGIRALRHGVFVALRLYPADAGVVFPHELTFAKAKADRLELLRATRTNTSPIFGLVDGAVMSTLGAASVAPAGDARLGEDRHRVIRITDAKTITAFQDAMRHARVYLADGHHRYETALRYADDRRAAHDAPERFVLAYLCALDNPGLRILATHRVIAGHRDVLGAGLRAFETSPIERGALDDMQPGIVLARDGHFTRLELRADADLSKLSPSWQKLPVAIAEELLVRPARDAGAEITYEHDTERAIEAATGGRTAILLRAVDPPTLRAVADAGERLPQKTTYFYPKVPAGLVIRSLDLG
ncbi:MAG TPA: DUF1015 domain-containing protein [Candidatus Acidoferrales bacterium]|nr:DUF1015 domain-containing protein [Candidatus Acidoferrales bacterium]